MNVHSPNTWIESVRRREAEELIDGSRETVTPMIEEATHRVLGEYVEAPTSLAQDPTHVNTLPESAGPPQGGRLARAQTIAAED